MTTSAIPGTANDFDYGYDAGGRVTSMTRDASSLALGYNAAGQVTSVGGSINATFGYDGSGNRTRVITSGTTRNVVVAPTPGGEGLASQQLVSDAGGNVLAGYVYGPGSDAPLLRFDAQGSPIYYLEDAMDSVGTTLNGGGATVSSVSYDAFGNATATAGTGVAGPAALGGEFGFHGGWRDASTGLYDLHARTYDPTTGRFTSRDPVEGVERMPETYNAYAYGHNSPHLYEDVSGAFSIAEINVSGAIQSNLQNLRAVAIQRAKKYATDTVKEAAVNKLQDVLANLLPINFKPVLDWSKGRKSAGVSFGPQMAQALADTLPMPNWMWVAPEVREDGSVVSNGFNGSNLTGFKESGNIPRPDYILSSDPPRDADRTWLIGDFALSGKTLYTKYVYDKRIGGPKQPSQWNAIMNHAQSKGLRIATFFTMWSGEKEHLDALGVKMKADGVKKGTLIFVVSLKQNKKGWD